MLLFNHKYPALFSVRRFISSIFFVWIVFSWGVYTSLCKCQTDSDDKWQLAVYIKGYHNQTLLQFGDSRKYRDWNILRDFFKRNNRKIHKNFQVGSSNHLNLWCRFSIQIGWNAYIRLMFIIDCFHPRFFHNPILTLSFSDQTILFILLSLKKSLLWFVYQKRQLAVYYLMKKLLIWLIVCTLLKRKFYWKNKV